MTGWQVDKMTIWQYDKIRDSKRKTQEFWLVVIDLFGRWALPPRNQGTRNSHLNSPWTTAPSALDDRKPPAASPGITHQTITRCTTGPQPDPPDQPSGPPITNYSVTQICQCLSPLWQVLRTIKTSPIRSTHHKLLQKKMSVEDLLSRIAKVSFARLYLYKACCLSAC